MPTFSSTIGLLGDYRAHTIRALGAATARDPLDLSGRSDQEPTARSSKASPATPAASRRWRRAARADELALEAGAAVVA